MHIVIDIRTLQLSHPHHNAGNHVLKKWLSAFLKMPSEDKITLLVDPRFEWPQLEVPLTGSYWKPASFKSHPEIDSLPNKAAEQLASHKTNHFLLEQEADLFHLTNPFLSAIPVGYPPIACPCVVTINDDTTQQLADETSFMQERLFGQTYYSKVQALRYASQIIANSQSVLNELAPWAVPSNRIELIDQTRLSPSEMALAMRKIYSKTRSEPFSVTTSRQTTSSDSPFAFTQLGELAAQADTVDHQYRVYSKVPLIGSRIARIRSHMTLHIREAYFNFIIARLVSFNQKLVKAMESACRLLAEYEQWLDLPSVKREPVDHAAQDIIDEAKQAIQKDQILNPYILAGPLPEYGACLGRSFYQQLYLASLHSSEADMSQSQTRSHQGLILELNQLAKNIEDYYEQSQTDQLIKHRDRQNRTLLYHEIVKDLSPEINVLLPECPQFKSDKAYIGGLINRMRRDLTSHLRVPYIDPILEQQVSFNRLAVNLLSNIDSLDPITLKQIDFASKITLAGKVNYSVRGVVGPLITWLQKQSTSHLYEYVVEFFKRQELFNQNVVELLVAIHQQRNVIHLHEHYYHLTKKNQFKQALARIKQQSFATQSEVAVALLVSQCELTSQILPLLIEQLNSLIERNL